MEKQTWKEWLKDFTKKNAAQFILWIGMVLTAYVTNWLRDPNTPPAPIPEPPIPIWQASFGWVPPTENEKEEAKKELMKQNGVYLFSDTDAAKFDLEDENGDIPGWRVYKTVTGKAWDASTHNQGSVGSCVSFGFASAAEYSLCATIATKKNPLLEYSAVNREAIYAGSRVEANGGRAPLFGDGSNGSWAAKWLSKPMGGLIPAAIYNGYDLTKYDQNRCRAWGRSGVPDELEPEARKHPCVCTLVTSTDDARRALAQGYFISVCSGQGFSSQTRDKDGFIPARGSWAHCVVGNTMISTMIPKEAKDVVVGDQVIGHDGRFHTVKEVHINDYKGEMVTLKSVGIMPTTVTSEHPVLVYKKEPSPRSLPAEQENQIYGTSELNELVGEHKPYQGMKLYWVPACEVNEGDYLVTPKQRLVSDEGAMPVWNTPSAAEKNVPDPIKVDDDFAWLCGLYIADGHALDDHRITITLGQHETELVNRARKVWRKYGLFARVTEGGTYRRVVVDSASAANSFKKWFGKDSSEKHIPEWAYSNGWNLKAFVQGIQDGDGFVRGDNSRANVINSISKSLCLQIQHILITNGECANLREVDRRGGGFPNASPMFEVNWTTQIRKPVSKHTDSLYLTKVQKKETSYFEGKVWNYEVEGVHSYLTNNLASHNCMSIIGYRKDRPGFLILNSWGANWLSGPKGKFDDIPDGSFWADEATVSKMLREGDSYAVASGEGFKKRKLNPDDWLVTIPASPLPVAQKGNVLYATAP